MLSERKALRLKSFPAFSADEGRPGAFQISQLAVSKGLLRQAGNLKRMPPLQGEEQPADF